MYRCNLQEFYPTAFIRIGENDHSMLKGSRFMSEASVHWLVALDGHPKNGSEEFYVWNVLVYLADTYGNFELSEPHYCTESYSCFEQACNTAKDLMISGLNDEMMKYTVRVRIS
jgi:hypothetical protein